MSNSDYCDGAIWDAFTSAHDRKDYIANAPLEELNEIEKGVHFQVAMFLECNDWHAIDGWNQYGIAIKLRRYHAKVKP